MMNGEASGKRRGFLRVSRHIGERSQRKLLEDSGVRAIYTESDGIGAFITSLRPGDEVWVSSLGRLASRRTELRAAIEAIHDKKCVIVEAASGRRSNRAADVTRMVLDAADELALDAKALKPWQARKFGAVGGKLNAARIRREQSASRLPPKEAANIWRNPLLTNAEALEKMPGWTQAAAYRHKSLGRRGLAKGRPKNKAKDHTSD